LDNESLKVSNINKNVFLVKWITNNF